MLGDGGAVGRSDTPGDKDRRILQDFDEQRLDRRDPGGLRLQLAIQQVEGMALIHNHSQQRLESQ